MNKTEFQASLTDRFYISHHIEIDSLIQRRSVVGAKTESALKTRIDFASVIFLSLDSNMTFD